MSDDKFKKQENRRDSELFNYHGISPAYIKFTENNKKFWVMLNLTVAITCGLFAFICNRILTMYPNECAGMKMANQMLQIFYVFNCCFAVLALMGLEKRFCNTCWLCMFLVFDCLIIYYAQNVFFKAQETNCMQTVTTVYGWLMGQILCIYCFIAFLICWIFRKHCDSTEGQDDDSEIDDDSNVDNDEHEKFDLELITDLEKGKQQDVEPVKQEPKPQTNDKPADNPAPLEKVVEIVQVEKKLEIQVPKDDLTHNRQPDTPVPLATSSSNQESQKFFDQEQKYDRDAESEPNNHLQTQHEYQDENHRTSRVSTDQYEHQDQQQQYGQSQQYVWNEKTQMWELSENYPLQN